MKWNKLEVANNFSSVQFVRCERAFSTTTNLQPSCTARCPQMRRRPSFAWTTVHRLWKSPADVLASRNSSIPKPQDTLSLSRVQLVINIKWIINYSKARTRGTKISSFKPTFSHIVKMPHFLSNMPQRGLRLFAFITGSAVELHCCKAHSKINRKMENSTPCIIATPENFILKLGTRDYVEDITYYKIFDVDRFSGGLLTK